MACNRKASPANGSDLNRSATTKVTPTTTKSLKDICDGAPPIKLKMPVHTVRTMQTENSAPAASASYHAKCLTQSTKGAIPRHGPSMSIPELPPSRNRPTYAAQVPRINEVPLSARTNFKYGPRIDVYVPTPEGQLDLNDEPLRICVVAGSPIKMWIAFSEVVRQQFSERPLHQYVRLDLEALPAVIKTLNGWMLAVCSGLGSPVIWTRRLDWLDWMPLFKAAEDLKMQAAIDQLVKQEKYDLREGEVSLSDTLALYEQARDIDAITPQKPLVDRIFQFLKGYIGGSITIAEVDKMVRIAPAQRFTEWAVKSFAAANYARDSKSDGDILCQASEPLQKRLLENWNTRRYNQDRADEAREERVRSDKERKMREGSTWDSAQGKFVTKAFW